ncbi:hypothetical protein BBJ28_00020722 [Nothophytophthora sp. Chile5]|nr:hypothetical protein BBJ28_00020722 [Nothophytophthora sp. Chile5]
MVNNTLADADARDALPALQVQELEAVEMDSLSETCSTTSSIGVRLGHDDDHRSADKLVAKLEEACQSDELHEHEAAAQHLTSYVRHAQCRQMGLITLIVVAAVSTYAMVLVVQCKYKLKQQGKSITKYGEIGYFAMGKVGSVVVNTALLVSQMGFCIAYLIFIASNAHKFLDVSKELVVSVCVPPLICFSLLKHMKELAYVALLADFMCILGLLVVLKIDLSYMPLDHDSIEAVGVLSGVPFFFGVASYCFEGVGMVLPLENSMQNKGNFTPILVCTVVIVTSLYATFGICGYLAFGESTDAVITLNFEGSGGLVTLVKLFLCLGLFFTYPVMLFPVFEVLQPLLVSSNTDGPTRTAEMKGVVLRASIVLLTALIAAAVPGTDVIAVAYEVLPCS